MIKITLIATAATMMLAKCDQNPNAKTTHVYNNCIAIDGDTVLCAKRNFRLLAVDAAEMPGHCRQGRKCVQGDPHFQKFALSQLLRDPLEITEITTDRYKRTVAIIVNAERQNLSCAMLNVGAEYKAEYDNENLIRNACPDLAVGR
jgi:micrococcal nuclease